MTFWLINIAIFGSYTVLFSQMKKEKIFLTVALIHLGIISALRGLNVGTDTLYYFNAYKILSERGYIYNHAMSSSPVFVGYLRLVSYILPFDNGYMISTAIPILLGVFFLIKKFSRNYFVSVYLYLTFYFYFYSMNATRHFFAIALSLLSFYLLNRKKTMAALALYFLALGVHSAAIIFGIYFIIHFIKWNEKKAGTVFLVILLGSFFVTQLLELFVRLFPNYRWMINNSFITSYASGGRTAMVISIYCIFTVFLMWYWILWSKRKVSISFGERHVSGAAVMDEGQIQISYELMILLFVVAVIEIFYPTIIMFTRMVNTLFVYIIILLPNALHNVKKYKKPIAFLVLAPLFIYMYMQIKGNYSGVLNYRMYGS